MNILQQIVIQIRSIFGGWSATYNGDALQGEYLDSIGIDPELSLGSLVRPGGAITPARYTKFSSLLSSAPMWISGGPTTSGVYVYEANGTVLSYGSALTAGSEAFEESVGTPTLSSGAGNGMVVWNDYLYCATASTISRKGRLSSSGPSWTYDYWVAGLSMSALTNSTYPSARNVTYPNHVLHAHSDGFVYIADYDGANGRIHAFITSNDGTGGTGTWNALTLPPGLMPMDMKSYGPDLAILCASEAKYASGAIPKPGHSELILWNTVVGQKAYQRIPIEAPLATALINKNGELYIVAGQIDSYVTLLRYLGGYGFETAVFLPEGSPPPAGAIDALGDMIGFGGYMTVPGAAAGVFGYGFRNGNLTKRYGRMLHHIARISDPDAGTLPIVSCLKFLNTGVRSHLVQGWRTDTTANFGLDKFGGAAAYQSVFRTKPEEIGKPFTIRRIRIPLSGAVTSGVSIRSSVYVDNETTATALTSINSTNYASSERIIDMTGLDIPGYANFMLRAEVDGTDEIAPLGISFYLDTYE